MKKGSLVLLLFTAVLLISTSAAEAAGKEEGAISPTLLKKMRGLEKDEGKINSISNNDIKKLLPSRLNAGKTDHYFSVRLDVKGITDQKSTGRCWLFTSLNVIRQKVREKFNLDSFEFSENYSFFWDQLEKANLFLEGIIETRGKDYKDRKVEWLFDHPVSDGGVWNMAVAVIEKYGLVPLSVMPETYHSSNTKRMRSVLRKKLREDGVRLRQMHNKGKEIRELREAKEEMLIDIYKLLVYHLGEPPAEFTWRYKDEDGNISDLKKYTPLEFFRETIDVDLKDYVMLMNDPTRPYYKLYEIEYDRDMVEAFNWTYINLPNAEIKKFARESLLDEEAMYFSCDVGKQLNRSEGLLSLSNNDYEALYGIKFDMNKKERILASASGSTHGMTLVGMETDKSGTPVKWLLENSWGKEEGQEGFITMTDQWFDEYMFRVVIHEEYISSEVLEILKTEPVQLHPWDPMFLPAEDK
ncbi:MAG: C1 family peptidase [Candidatus Krumholzibacteriota bacterium]|nr:C1 family peptidase [Candidatus Krumholzibacteriota bacterium]